MAKKLQLKIAEPCHENWDGMTTVEKARPDDPFGRGKFCGSCQKEVVDFSNMSDQQLVAFFKKPSTGSLCGRFNSEQLDRDMEIPRKRIPWLKYFFHIAIPAFLLTIKASGQKGRPPIMGKIAPVCSKPLMGITVPVKNVQPDKPKEPAAKSIQGKIIDESGNPVAYATVIVKGTKTGAAADELGNFNIDIKAIDTKKMAAVTLLVSAIGYNAKEVSIDNKTSLIKVEMIQLQTAMQGEVVVTMGLVATKKTKPVPILKQLFKDTAFLNFSVFPNPLPAGSVVNINWNKKQPGNYTVQLFSQSGNLIHTWDLHIDEKSRLLNVQLPSVSAGSYFIKMTNRKTGKFVSEKIIIE
jgi:CarboxypepD_reg-like domain/Secretion system C-terminal sorting domain